MDRWEKLREVITNLHNGNTDNPDIEFLTRYLLAWMEDLDEEERRATIQ